MALKDVKAWSKNFKQSMKYSFEDYFKSSTPAMYDANEKYADTLRDYSNRLIDTVNNGQNIRVRDLFKKIPVFQDVKTLYKNSIEDIKTGKFYNKERMDAAMEKTMQDQLGGGFNFDMDFDKSFDANMDMGFDDLNNSTNETDTFAQDFDIGMQASASTISSATLTGSSMVSDTIRASTQYTSIQIFETNQILKRCFGDLNRNVMDIVGFNKTTLTTHIENATQYFQKTTELMSENNAILKEMLEMQRNMYKNAQEQEYQKSDRITYSDIVGSNGLPDLDKLKEYFKQQYKGSMFGMLSDLNKMGMKDMLLSAPLQFITNTLASTIIGPKLDRSLKDFDKTVSGLFAGIMQKLNNTADKGDIFNPLTWIADMFGLKTYEKTTINTANFVKGPMPFNGLANYSLINVIPNYLRNIEAALTGGPVRVFNYDTGKWTTDVAISKQYSYERNRDLSYAFSPISDAAAPYLQSISFEKNGKVDKKAQKQLFADFANFLMSTVDDNGYFEFDFDKNKKLRDRREYQRRNVSSAENMDIIANILDSIPGYKRTQMMGSVRQFKDSRTRTMDEIERGFASPYRDLFNDAFIYDYSAGVTNRYGPAMQGGKRFSGGQKILEKNNPVLNALNNIHKESFITRHILEDIRDNGGGFSNLNNNPVGGRGPVRNKKRGGKSREEALWERRNKRRSNMDKANDEFYPIYNAIGESYENQSVTGIFGENYYDRMNINEDDILKSIRKNSAEINEQARKYSSSDQYQGMFDKKFYARYNALKGETATDKIKNADTLKDRFVAVTGFLVQLRDKPAEFMANLVDSMNDSINNFFFNRPTTLIDEDGRKVEGFFDTSVYYLKRVFENASDYLVNNVFDPLSNYIDENFDEDSKIRQGKDVLFDVAKSIKNSFKRVGRDIMGKSKGDIGEDGEMSLAWKKWMVQQYGPYNYDDILKREKQRKEDPNYQDDMSQRYIDRVILELIDKGEIPSVYGGKAFGDRYIKKTGLYALSKGEAVIPSTRNPFNPYLDSADTKKDARNEKFLLNKYKRMGIPVEGSYAEGTLTDDALEEKTYREKLAKAKEKAIGELEEVYPDLLRGASYGALGGLILQGGPYGILAGSAIGTGLAIAKNSQSVQEFLFGNMENYQDGFLGKFKFGQFLKKYGPAMKDYGIVGAVAGSFLPVGALGGMLIGAAAGWASQSDKFQELIFGTDEKRNKVQRFLNEHMLRGVAGVTIGGLAGGALLGPFGAVGGTLLGGALSFASTTDKFKDMMLGELDPATGKRKGGLLSKIEAVTVDPLKERMKEMQDGFLNYLKKQILSPVDHLVQPVMQSLKYSITDTFKRIGDFAKEQFTPSKMKFFMDRLFGGKSNTMAGVAAGGLASLFLGIDPVLLAGAGGLLANTRIGRFIGRNTIGRIAKAPASIAKKLGSLGDNFTRRNISRGIASNMTAEQRRNMMAGKDYAYRDFDIALAGANSEDIQGMLDSLSGYQDQMNQYKTSNRQAEDNLLDTIRTSGIDRKHWNTLLKAAKSGDAKSLLKAFEKTNTSAMPKEDREALKSKLSDAAKQYAQVNATNDKIKAVQELAKQSGMDLSDPREVEKYRKMLQTELETRKEEESKEEEIPENIADTITNKHLSTMAENTQGMVTYLDAILRSLNGQPVDANALSKQLSGSASEAIKGAIKGYESDVSDIQDKAKDVEKNVQAAADVAKYKYDKYGIDKLSPISDQLRDISDDKKELLMNAIYRDPKVFDKFASNLFKNGKISSVESLIDFSNLDQQTASRLNRANKRSNMKLDQDTIKVFKGASDDEYKNNIKPLIDAGIEIQDPASLLTKDPSYIKQLVSDSNILRGVGIDLGQVSLQILQKNTAMRPYIIDAAAQGDGNKTVDLLAKIGLVATRDYTKKTTKAQQAKNIAKTVAGGVADAVSGTVDATYQATKATVMAPVAGVKLAAKGVQKAATAIKNANPYSDDNLLNKAKSGNLYNERQKAGEESALEVLRDAQVIPQAATGTVVDKTGPVMVSKGEAIVTDKSDSEIKQDIQNESKEIDKLKERADTRETKERREDTDSSQSAISVLQEAMSDSIEKSVEHKMNAAKANGGKSSSSSGKADVKEVSTQYGIQTYKLSSNGQYALDDTKANKEVSQKIEDEVNDRKESKDYLKIIADKISNLTGTGGVVAEKKDDGSLLDSLFGGPGKLLENLLSFLGLGPLAPILASKLAKIGGKAFNLISKPFKWVGKKLDAKLLQPVLAKIAGRFGLNMKGNRYSITDMLRQGKDKVVTSAKNTINKGIGKALDFGKSSVSKVKTSAGEFLDAMKSAPGKAENALSNAADNTLKKLSIFGAKAKDKAGSLADKASKLSEKTQSKLAEAIASIKDGLKKIAAKAAEYAPKYKKKIASLCEGIMKKVTSPKIVQKAAAKMGAQVAATTGVGLLVTAAGAAYCFYDGWSNAGEYWGLKEDEEPTTMQKVVAGFANAATMVIPVLGWFIDGGDIIAIGKALFGSEVGQSANATDKSKPSSQTSQNPNNDKSIEGKVVKKGLLATAAASATAFGKDMFEAATNIGKNFLDSAKQGFGYIYDKISNIGKGLITGAQELWNNIKQNASKYLPSLDDVKTTASNAVDTLKQWGSDAVDTVKQWGSKAYDFVSNGASSLANSVSGFLDRRNTTGPNTGKGKYGRGNINPNNFASQLDPSVQQRYNAPGDTEYQTMADSGCGPGAAANAVAGLGGNLDITSAANYALINGYKEKNGGTKPQYFTDILGKLGMSTDNISRNNQSIISNLKQGNPVILMGKDGKVSEDTPYGPGVHYVTATGINDAGNIIIQDSESDGPNKVYPVNKVLNKSSIAIAAKPKTRSVSAMKKDANTSKKMGKSKYGLGYTRKYIPSRKYGRGYRFGKGPGEEKAGPAIWNLLHQVGFNDIGAAGVMGNMMKESNLYPDIVQGGTHAPEITCDGSTGYGLCQWTYITRQQALAQYAQQNGASSSDPGLQISFIAHEAQTVPEFNGLIQACNACSTPTEAARTFHEIYEGSADVEGGIQKRCAWAEEAFQKKGDIAGANGSNLAAQTFESGGPAGSTGSSSGGKSYSGLFGAFDMLNDSISDAFSNLGLGKYGRSRGVARSYRFGKGPEEETTDTKTSTDDKATDAQASTDNKATDASKTTQTNTTAQKNTKQAAAPSGGMFESLLNPAKSKITAITEQFKQATAPFKSALKQISNSTMGKAMASIFGTDIFSDFFGGDNKSKRGKPGSGGANAGGNSSNPDINAASQYANSRVGTQGYGNNGCTTWVNDYLTHAGVPNIDLWVPNAMDNSQKGQPARWKDPSEGAVEGDVAVIETNHNRSDGPDHVVIADGQGGYWGNSSSRNQIVHSSMAGDWGAENIWGYIGTGGDGAGNVAKGGMTRDASEAAGDATLDGQGKYGRSKYGRSIKNTFLEKQKHLKKSVFGRAKEVFDAINSNYDAGYNEQQDSINAVSPALNMAEAAQNANAAIAQTQVQAKQDSDKVDVMIGLLSSMNNYLSIIANSIANLGGAATPATVSVNNVNTAATPAINPMDLPETFNRDDLRNIVEAMTSIAKKK